MIYDIKFHDFLHKKQLIFMRVSAMFLHPKFPEIVVKILKKERFYYFRLMPNNWRGFLMNFIRKIKNVLGVFF